MTQAVSNGGVTGDIFGDKRQSPAIRGLKQIFSPPMLVAQLNLEIEHAFADTVEAEMTGFDNAGMHRSHGHFVNFVSGEMALDSSDRLWIISYLRQLEFKEMGLTMHFMDGDGRYEGSEPLKTSEHTKIDAFAFTHARASAACTSEYPVIRPCSRAWRESGTGAAGGFPGIRRGLAIGFRGTAQS